jgi:hypothetical protein
MPVLAHSPRAASAHRSNSINQSVCAHECMCVSLSLPLSLCMRVCACVRERERTLSRNLRTRTASKTPILRSPPFRTKQSLPAKTTLAQQQHIASTAVASTTICVSVCEDACTARPLPARCRMPGPPLHVYLVEASGTKTGTCTRSRGKRVASCFRNLSHLQE